MAWIEPPIPWLWIAGIAGVVALAIAMPSLLQMIYGKPKIEVLFYEGRNERQGANCLSFQFYNRPIENRFLRKIGVYRRAVDSMSILFSVESIHDSEIVVTDIVAEIYTAHDTPKVSVSLPASAWPANIDLVKAKSNGKANTIAPRQSKNIDIPPDEYHAIIRIEAEGKESIYSRRFTVGLKPEDLKWESA